MARKAIISDPCPLFRCSLKYLLQKIEKELLICETQTSEDTSYILQSNPDTSLLFLSFEDISSKSILDEISSPRIRIVTIVDDIRGSQLTCIPPGLFGLVPKSYSYVEMEAACRRILKDETYFSKKIIELQSISYKATTLSKRVQTLIAKLTLRQKAVFELVTQGLTNAEISEKLGISTNTVRSHVAAVLRTLEVPNRGKASQLGRAYFDKRA